MRLSQAARKFNVGIARIAELLASKGFSVDAKPNAKITPEEYEVLEKEFESSMAIKRKAAGINIGSSHEDVIIKSDLKPEGADESEDDEIFILDQSGNESAPKAEPAVEEEKKEEPVSVAKNEIEEAPVPEVEEPKAEEEPDQVEKASKLKGLTVLDKIELDAKGRPVKSKPVEKEPVEEVKEEPAVAEVKQEEPPIEEVKEEPVKEEEPVAEVEKEEKQEESSVEKVEEEEKPVEAKVEIEQPPVVEKPVAEVKKEEKAEEEKTESKVEKVVEEQTKKDIIEDVETPEAEVEEEVDEQEEESKPAKVIEAKADKLQGLTVLGKIDLPSKDKKKAKPVASSDDQRDKKKRKRKRVRISKENEKDTVNKNYDKTSGGDKGGKRHDKPSGGKDFDGNQGRDRDGRDDRRGKNKRTPFKKEEVSQKEVQEKYKETMARMSGSSSGKSSKSKYRKEKRDAIAAKEQEQEEAVDHTLLRVTEFISTNDLATLMEVSVNEIIANAMKLGMFVSINQRLDADSITMLADEFGFSVEFTSAEEEIELVLEEEDKEEDLEPRAPIVTIMGHVDHGKTSLLDYIRNSKVADAEAGGITQHIGAYKVKTESGKDIVFLDTPGHEAFTAMRARGAKLTDVAIIVIAADDSVMPQTVEAINHAQVAGVPIVIAINKIDKPGANSHKIKEELSQMNILVEEWGGKVQCQEVSAKSGLGIDDLLEMVVLEADILELRANPNKKAIGTVVEASLDKGRGYVTTILVQSGELKIGSIMLAGHHYGRVKAMTDSWGKRLKKAGPSTPVQVLGLNGAPQAGDKMNVMESEREAREISNKREQILREQSIRATKRTTLSDIGKRIAMGNFQQLNVIIKGDVDGSVEALSDSLQKLSADEVEVNIIHKAVGPISDNDILLASASEAIVIGFQVRPTPNTRRLAEREDVEIRLYSVIYHAIEEVKAAMEGLLSADIEEEIVGTVEVREVYKISKVGTVAGCYVTEGYIKRNSKIRLIRDGIVIYGGETGGEIQALKRFKDDVSEVKQSFECGISIKNYNDLKVGDVIEAYEEKEIKRTLK
ncbi:translation initiation factor IF-2 [Flexithrix dorotheae]|uniref:translation initiation factor IF-2 n=1 Tax=Flexithrix dorotheae TaxID=70993 RepID=UPI000361BBDB|nr:translation initiation factor IF-2 [Flexithrix dorotheae]